MIKFKPKKILELGIFAGKTALWVAKTLPDDGIMFAVDSWNVNFLNFNPIFLNNLYDQFLSNVIHSGLQNKIIPLRMDTATACKKLNQLGEKFDLIHIDTGHDDEVVKRDLADAFPLLSDNGVLTGDDFNWNDYSLGKIIVNFAKEKNMFLFTYGRFWWMTKLKIDLLDFKKCNEKTKLSTIGLTDIYVINLDRRKDKLNKIQKQLYLLDLPFTRFSSFDGLKIKEYREDFNPLNLDPRTKVNMAKMKELVDQDIGKAGVVGTWLSHLHVYFNIVDNAHKTGIDGPVLILEDDACFEENTKELLFNALNSLPNSWELFYPGGCNHICKNDINSKICRLKESWCAHSYVIKNSLVAEKLIEYSNKWHEIPADWALVHSVKNTGMEAYLYRPYFIIQDRKNFNSDIPASSPIAEHVLSSPILKD